MPGPDTSGRETTAIFWDTRVAIAHNSSVNERWDSFLSLAALSFLQSQWQGGPTTFAPLFKRASG